ncbi:hypothetical protein Lal_00039925 [Lupinus albus]|nr:hypothetical protein Lal_00039925 [Lupinus albus]
MRVGHSQSHYLNRKEGMLKVGLLLFYVPMSPDGDDVKKEKDGWGFSRFWHCGPRHESLHDWLLAQWCSEPLIIVSLCLDYEGSQPHG